MLSGYHNQISPNIPFKADSAITAPLAKPIETVQKTIEDSFDTLVGGDEKKSHARRNAIAVGSSVLVLSGLVALLNPRFSPKLMEKLKSLSGKAGKKADSNKSDTFWNKFYKACEKASQKAIRSFSFISNFTSAKDSVFKEFCTEEKAFLGIKNKSLRNALKKVDTGVRKVLKKPHEAITSFFDKVSQRTVLAKYEKSSKKMDSFEELIKMHKDKLTDTQKVELEAKLAEIRKLREYFSETRTQERFAYQEDAMKNLERDFWTRYRAYKNGFSDKVHRAEHVDKNMTFWAQEILNPVQTKLKEDGANAVSKLVGKEANGAYDEVLEILAPHLSLEENALMKKSLKDVSVSLEKANKSECIDYFDKKRDLTLGSAPTDILTALVGLGLSGVALTGADNNDERISKLLTKVFPIVGGLGASFIFAAQLISGPIGLVYSFGVGALLNYLGSFADKHILGNKEVKGD